MPFTPQPNIVYLSYTGFVWNSVVQLLIHILVTFLIHDVSICHILSEISGGRAFLNIFYPFKFHVLIKNYRWLT